MNVSFKSNPNMKTPKSRKRRGRMFGIVISFCIVLIGIGVGSTVKRLWDNTHKTDTHNVEYDEKAVEEQVLSGIQTKKLKDLSAPEPVKVTYDSVSKDNVHVKTVKQPTNTEFTITDMGYVSENKTVKKLLTDGQKAGNVFYVTADVKNVSNKSVSYDGSYPLLNVMTESKVGKSSKKFPDGELLYQGYTVSGVPFLNHKSAYSYNGKSLKKNGHFEVTYLFDLTNYKKDSHQKLLQVYTVDKNHTSTLTHQYTIKE